MAQTKTVRKMARAHLMAVLLSSGLLCVTAAVAFAQTKGSSNVPSQTPASQTPLRAQSNLVLVPVFVYDPSRMEQAPKDELPCARSTLIVFFKLKPTEPYLPKDCDVTEVHDLTAKDFRLFQDGVEQEIGSFEAGAWRTVVRDNLGWHIQFSGTPRGIWSLSELSPLKKVPFMSEQFHILEYVPNNAKQGCHHIRVEVDRPNFLVFAKDQYCTGQTPSDPLFGTGRGKDLEQILTSKKRGKIPLTLQAAVIYPGKEMARVDISLGFPWNDLYRKWDPSNWTLYARIGIVGVLRSKGGDIAARFSDLLYPSYWPAFDQGGTKYIAWEKGSSTLSSALPTLLNGAASTSKLSSSSDNGNDTLALTFRRSAGEIRPDENAINSALISSDPFWLPTRYETQIDIPPGEYDLEVVLSDEWEFGRAEIPLTVGPYEAKQLRLSSVALCKRLRDAAVAAKEAAAANFAPQYVPFVSKGIWFTPEGDTNIEKGEPLYAYFEVYEPLLAQQQTQSTEVHLRILEASTGKVIGNFAPVNVAPYQRPNISVIPIARKIPIDQFPKGAYQLEVQASDSATGESTAWREARFTVK
jgi:hypothetical protein